MNFLNNVFSNWQVDVQVALKNNVFYPGNVVEGVVTVSAKAPINFSAIRLKICGKEKVRITQKEAVHHPDGKVTYIDRHYNSASIIIKQLITLAGNLKYGYNNGAQHMMPPGTYHYPFAYQLPSNLAPSFDRKLSDDHAAIHYYAKAYVDIPMGRDAVKKVFFTVVRPIPQSQWINRAPVNVSRNFDVTCCCCIDKGHVKATIMMDRTCIAMDRDWLQVFADVDNTNGQEPVESLEVTLRHTLHYKAEGRTEVHSYPAGHKFIGDKIIPGQKGLVNSVIELPRNLTPSFVSPNVSSKYVITVELNIPWASDPCQVFPVVVAQSVDETNVSPPLNFDSPSTLPFLPAHAPCPEYFYMPPPQPVFQYQPITGWAPPPNAQFMAAPPAPTNQYLPPQSWVQGNQPPPAYGAPTEQSYQWGAGYTQTQAAEYAMAPPSVTPLGMAPQPQSPYQKPDQPAAVMAI